jgi:hypothetical protein
VGNRRLNGFYSELDEVVRSLKAVHNSARYQINGKLGRWEDDLKDITAFLINIRGKRVKNMFEMGIEYFGRVDEFYKSMGQKGFRLTHMYSRRTCDDFKEYIFARGSLYWDGQEVKKAPEQGKEIDLRELKVAFRKKCAENTGFRG